MSERLGVVLGTILALASVSQISAQEVSLGIDPLPSASPAPSFQPDYPLNPDNYDWRAAIMGPKSIYICYSDSKPFHVEDPRQIPPVFIAVDNADCLEVLPTLEVVIYEGFTADIDNPASAAGDGYEITNLAEIRNAGKPYPPIFDNITDNTVYYAE